VTTPRLLAGRYQLERRLGRGGMGTVYVALDTSLDRRVAAKLVREDLVGLPEAAERFQREARVAAAFSHPNVVTVHDFGVAGGHAFLVMELLDGRTLRDLLRAEERVECQRALAILRDVTAAVEAAHRRQLVHRDLKPENICLVSYGSGESAKVLDFGIAKFLTPKDGELLMTHTTGGALLGTPWYMAPEQLRGEDPDPSWDLWALAVIAFEMLSGSHPFASVTLARDLRTREAATDPRLANLPHGCQQFFARALALDRAARPESPAVFLSELERSLHA
jgi:serine/threonine-protein kinase